ncbi:hypothetical protein [Persephonella sp.]|uniref:hypothetical protein n=1 Tax=Persephonella sp. TaxID=2060922 RepID=UPI0025D10C3C|nr:hypothetical protein [Persephonella sp.]
MKIAYINFYSVGNRYRAGALITDSSTRPVEFRVTSDLNIDKLQEILYGEALQEVLYKERFTVQLLKSMQEEYDIVLIKDKNLMSIRNEINIPVVHIQKFDQFMPLNRLSRKIINIHDRYEPLYITVNKEDEKRLVGISHFLQEMYRNFNIMEPFKRIENAIKYIMENSLETERADICIR